MVSLILKVSVDLFIDWVTIKKDNLFGLDQTLGLVLICIHFSSDNKRLVLS